MVSNKGFSTGWFSTFVGDSSGVIESLQEIKDFAYEAFDKLDVDCNGYLERDELVKALVSEKTMPAEKEFINFLLSNQEQIASAFDEQDPANRDGISRADLESYFQLIMNLI